MSISLSAHVFYGMPLREASTEFDEYDSIKDEYINEQEYEK